MPLNALFLFISFSTFSSIRISKQQKLSGVVYHKLKATREREERKCAVSLHVVLLKNM